MTDEKIKEKLVKSIHEAMIPDRFLKSSYEERTKEAVVKLTEYGRLAKIEVLEGLLKRMDSLSSQSAIKTIDDMLSEIKAGN